RGSQRIPDTSANPKAFQRPDMSPDYVILNAQISKRWKDDLFEIYLGGENLLDYQQRDAIIASEDAFGQYFDGSLVYAPLFGKMIYIGFRYNLKK
ncbi:MAG: TonB-dependent receptor, partial [Saprospiraceae bacterium]|nr:TonB-dependent receptor [Saprospiraceae bacterium]